MGWTMPPVAALEVSGPCSVASEDNNVVDAQVDYEYEPPDAYMVSHDGTINIEVPRPRTP